MSDKTKSSATPSLDLLNDPNPTGYRKCKLKEGALPHYVRKGKVVAGDEFVTDAKHAKELFQVGAVDILDIADGPDLSPVEAILAATDDKPQPPAKADEPAK